MRITGIGALVLLGVTLIVPGAAQQSRKMNYAVVTIKNAEGVTSGNTEVIADRLRAELFKTGQANIMERDQMQEVLKEQGFQQSGACTDEACMVELGQMLGVERLISGSIGKLGSMYLVNFRAIDVRTGKIVRVVSVDIRGRIEDVVTHLPGIARKLVNESAEQTVVSVTAEAEPVPDEDAGRADEGEGRELDEQDYHDAMGARTDEEPGNNDVDDATGDSSDQQEDEDEDDGEDEEEDEEEASDDATVDRYRKNRSGVRLCLMIFPGQFEHTWSMEDTSFYGTGEDQTYTAHPSGYGDVLESNTALSSIQIRFMIKAGRFLAIELGPGISFAREKYVSSYYNSSYVLSERSLELAHTIISFESGLTFSYRIYPIKINGGLLLNLGVPITRFTAEDSLSDETFSAEYDSPSAGIAFGLGFRAGAEFMAGPHVGFALDGIFRPMSYLSAQTYWDDSFSSYTVYDDVNAPKAGIGLSANFYF
jgi:hypothetical protein